MPEDLPRGRRHLYIPEDLYHVSSLGSRLPPGFASVVELGRRGTGHLVNPKRVELKRKAEVTRVHEAYFKCPVKFEARRNILVLHTADLDRPLLAHNAELLEMLDPQLDKALKEQRTQRSISEQVKWILNTLVSCID